MNFEECKEKLAAEIIEDVKSMLAASFQIHGLASQTERLLKSLILSRLHYQVLTFSKETPNE